MKDRAIAGSHDYEQISALIDRSKQRVANFYGDFYARLTEVPFVAGDEFSAADITMLVTIDFATRAFEMPIPPICGALRRWYDRVASETEHNSIAVRSARTTDIQHMPSIGLKENAPWQT